MKTRLFLSSLVTCSLLVSTIQAEDRDLTTHLYLDIPMDEEVQTTIPKEHVSDKDCFVPVFPAAQGGGERTLGEVVYDSERDAYVRKIDVGTLDCIVDGVEKTLSNICLNYVQSPVAMTIAGSAARTYAFWAKPEGGNSLQYLFTGNPTHTGDDGNVDFGGTLIMADAQGFHINTTAAPTIYMAHFSDENSRGIDPKEEVWHHFVFTIPEGAMAESMVLYIDGEYYATGNAQTLISGVSADTDDFSLNTIANRLNIGHTFNGYLSGLKVYDVDLTAEEVKTLYAPDGTTTSIDEMNDETLLAVANGTIYAAKNATVEVYDMAGKLISQVANATNPIVCNHLNGIYIVRAYAGNKIEQVKVAF